MNPMNFRRRLAAGMVLGIVFIALEFLVHHVLLKGAYQETASLWRPKDEIKNIFGFLIGAEFLFGVLFGIVYAQGYEPRRGPLGQGFRYGLIMGLMLAPLHSFVWYVILPVPTSLCVQWLIAGFAQMVLLGLIASFVYKPAQ